MKIFHKITSVSLFALVCTVAQGASSAFAASLTAGFPDYSNNPTQGYYQPFSSNVATGTGQFDTFLAIQDPRNGSLANGTEAGYNTDIRPLLLDNQEADTSTNKTRVFALNTFAELFGTNNYYLAFALDANEDNSVGAPNFQLQTLQFFWSTSNQLTGYNPATNTLGGGSGSVGTPVTPFFNFEANSAGGTDGANIALTEQGQGSGRADYIFYIPTSNLPSDFRTNPNYYLYMYSQLTGVEGGFEEWGRFKEDFTLVPTPALLPGLLGMTLGVLRKRKQEALEKSEA